MKQTNYYDTPQARKSELHLSWNRDHGRLLIPDSQRDMLNNMDCNRVVITKKTKEIHILFDDGSSNPFSVVITHQQNDKAITKGNCLLAIYIGLDEKYRFPCKCIIQHGNVGNNNASTANSALLTSRLNIRCKPTSKIRWIKQCEREGDKNLQNWVNKTLDAAIDAEFSR